MTFWREIFGEEYAAVAETAIANRWIDVFTSRGKKSGAYAWVAYGNHPYMLLNWAGTFVDVLTLVHEMGHIVHMNLTNTHQPYYYTHTSNFVAEVASLTGEILFIDWAIQRSQDPQERAAILGEAVDLTVATFVAAILYHEFEEAIYSEAENGRPLTKETMSAKYLELDKAYYGPNLTLNATDGLNFLRIPHYYYNYYLWVYATSYAAGEAIASRFRNGTQVDVDNFLEMLKLGSSVYPMEALRVAGVDFQDPSVIAAVMSRLQNLMAQLQIEIDEAGDL